MLNLQQNHLLPMCPHHQTPIVRASQSHPSIYIGRRKGKGNWSRFLQKDAGTAATKEQQRPH